MCSSDLVPFKNKFNFYSYLYNNGNLFYISDSFKKNNWTDSFYTEYPVIENNDKVSYSNFLLFDKNFSLLKNYNNKTNYQNFVNSQINYFTNYQQLTLLKEAYISNFKQKQKYNLLATYIISFLKIKIF